MSVMEGGVVNTKQEDNKIWNDLNQLEAQAD